MTETKKITIIVPVYKTEKYINQCIDSIINQTYKGLEIILVDDGSPDSCPKICDEYAKQDNRIQVIHKANGGLSAVRNTGLDIATGDYICFVDSDDWIEKDMIEYLLSSAVDGDYDVVGCKTAAAYTDGIVTNTCDKEKEIFDGREMMKGLLNGEISAFCCTKLYKKEVVSSKRFALDIYLTEDLMFNFELIRDNIKNICVLSEPKYIYRQRKSGLVMSGAGDGEKGMQYFDKIVDYAVSLNDKELIDIANKRKFEQLFYFYYSFSLSGNKDMAKKTKKEIMNYKSKYGFGNLNKKQKARVNLSLYAPALWKLIEKKHAKKLHDRCFD